MRLHFVWYASLTDADNGAVFFFLDEEEVRLSICG